MYPPRQQYPSGSLFRMMKGPLIVLVIFILVIFAVDRLILTQKSPGRSPAMVALDHLRHHDVKRTTIAATAISLELKDGTTLRERIPADRDLWPLLQSSGADIAVVRGDAANESSPLVSIVLRFLPIFVMALLLLFILRRARQSAR